MPSTHAIVGFVVPGSVIIFTMYRYIYPFSLLLATSVYVLSCTVQIHIPLPSTPSYIYVRLIMYRYIYPFSLLLAASMYVLSCTDTYIPLLSTLSYIYVCIIMYRYIYPFLILAIHLCTYYHVQIHLPLPSTPSYITSMYVLSCKGTYTPSLYY